MTPYWAEFDLRAAGGVRRVLMQRRRNDPASVWRDIATFDSYNDAEHVLRLLQGRIGDAGAPSVPGDESGNPDAPVEDRT